jgi:uncharacterized Fe-S cluster-containing radical SAM superfamily protein
MSTFEVCPPQGRQLLDINKEDLFGAFRICKTYKSGGGYDQFADIAKSRNIQNYGDRATQFVVQLYGCHLRCPYCYVTRDGIFGEVVRYTAAELVEEFLAAYKEKNCGTFHLMGGAPALYIKQWASILNLLPQGFIFTSDMLLTEHYYGLDTCKSIAIPNTLYAVNIKGVTSSDYYKNTQRFIDWKKFWTNLDDLVEAGVNFYFTFTNPDPKHILQFIERMELTYGKEIMNDAFIIDLQEYEAIKCGPAW